MSMSGASLGIVVQLKRTLAHGGDWDQTCHLHVRGQPTLPSGAWPPQIGIWIGILCFIKLRLRSLLTSTAKSTIP